MTEEQAQELSCEICTIPKNKGCGLVLHDNSAGYCVYWNGVLFSDYEILRRMLLDIKDHFDRHRWYYSPHDIMSWINDTSGKSDQKLLWAAPGVYTWLRRDIEEDEK